MKPTLRAALLAAASLAASPVLAQTTTLIEIESDRQVVAALGNLTVDEIEDMRVVGADGALIGEVEEVLGTPDGQPTALAIEFDIYPEIDDVDVIVPLDSVTLVDGRIAVSLSAEEIVALPVWDD